MWGVCFLNFAYTSTVTYSLSIFFFLFFNLRNNFHTGKFQGIPHNFCLSKKLLQATVCLHIVVYLWFNVSKKLYVYLKYSSSQ